MLAVASMMVLAFGVLSPLLLGDQPHFSGSPAELAATAIMLACAAGFVWLFIVRIGRAPLGTVGWGTFHLNRDMGFGVLGYVATTSILITLLLAKGASLQYFWQELTSFSLGQRLQFLLIGVQVVVSKRPSSEAICSQTSKRAPHALEPWSLPLWRSPPTTLRLR